MRSAVFAALLSALLLPQAQAAAPGDLQTLRRHALELVNKARRQHGLNPLRPSQALDRAAQYHAEDMDRRNYYAHESPEGKSVADRYRRFGGSKWKLTEENIARCEGCRLPATPATVARLQDGWMNSPEHRENILRPGIDSFGYGIVIDPQRGLYAVQTFAGAGAPRGTEFEAGAASARDQAARAMLHIVNAARKQAGVPALTLSPALSSAAHNLLPDPKAEDFALHDDLLHALPATARHDFFSLQTLAAACGGCGVKATAADVAWFGRDWLEGKYRKVLLEERFRAFGFAIAADGEGKKVAVLVLGATR
jgi:uncharacterized protein YkwD